MIGPLNLVLYGNLILIIIHTFVIKVSTFNFYLIASVGLNIFILSSIGGIKKLPLSFGLLLVVGFVGVLTTLNVMGIYAASKVFTRYFWFLTNAFLIYSLLKHADAWHFEQLRRFFIVVAILIILDMFFSIVVYDKVLVEREGLQTLIITPGFVKYLSFMCLPFLIASRGRYLIVAFIIFVPMLLGTRAGMLAGLFTVLFMAIIASNMTFKNNRTLNVISVMVLCFVIVLSSLTVIRSERKMDLIHSSSLNARVAIWFNYLSLLKEYPLGVGPQGGYKILESHGNQSTLDPHVLYGIVEEREISERMQILANKSKATSEESMHVGFIVSFGIVGILIWLHLVIRFLRDFRYAMSYLNKEFTLFYVALGSVFIYGTFNSFHLGGFFVALLYVCYFVFRNITHQSRQGKKGL
jgi:hypothetical protein